LVEGIPNHRYGTKANLGHHKVGREDHHCHRSSWKKGQKHRSSWAKGWLQDQDCGPLMFMAQSWAKGRWQEIADHQLWHEGRLGKRVGREGRGPQVMAQRPIWLFRSWHKGQFLSRCGHLGQVLSLWQGRVGPMACGPLWCGRGQVSSYLL
jgi:hypothetical protein